jgi:hypothetical protein
MLHKQYDIVNLEYSLSLSLYPPSPNFEQEVLFYPRNGNH